MAADDQLYMLCPPSSTTGLDKLRLDVVVADPHWQNEVLAQKRYLPMSREKFLNGVEAGRLKARDGLAGSGLLRLPSPTAATMLLPNLGYMANAASVAALRCWQVLQFPALTW